MSRKALSLTPVVAVVIACSNGAAVDRSTHPTRSTARPSLTTPGAHATTVVAGYNHTCARMADATVRCWGANDHGQLGAPAPTACANTDSMFGVTGSPQSCRDTPADVGLVDVAAVAAAADTTCALLGDGTVRCWGGNTYGAVGDGTTTDRPLPGGFNRMHAILGASEQCIAVNPSDMSVALAALEAVVHVTGPEGDRAIAFAEFHRLPGDAPQLDTNLRQGELITAVELPARGFAEHHAYLKIRDRASYAFALVSVAAALELQGGTSPRRVSPSAASLTSRGETARPRRCWSVGAWRPSTSSASPTRCCRARSVAAPTTSRSNWRGGPSSAH